MELADTFEREIRVNSRIRASYEYSTTLTVTGEPEVSTQFKAKCKLMLIDEAQDLSLLHLRVISMLTDLSNIPIRYRSSRPESRTAPSTSWTLYWMLSSSPGTGKTYTAIGGLLFAELYKQIPGDCIYAMSFTNMATGELMSRYTRSCRKLGISNTSVQQDIWHVDTLHQQRVCEQQSANLVEQPVFNVTLLVHAFFKLYPNATTTKLTQSFRCKNEGFVNE